MIDRLITRRLDCRGERRDRRLKREDTQRVRDHRNRDRRQNHRDRDDKDQFEQREPGSFTWPAIF